ncbi:MAG: alpha/beta hydrolase [Actinobacteria bacterium]|nr:alpha/beta hydrolase [Actinomycetota bacterium]MCL5446646.1 alpha/beta hydrolase [Actinomycetota bacterium]
MDWRAPDGVEISYEVVGEGPPVLLLHGFASDARTNWVRTGVVDALVDCGFQVAMYDARGHGKSGKPHDPAAYATSVMLDDARGLIEHLGYPSVHVVGYSMGAKLAMRLAADYQRVQRAVLGGLGDLLVPIGVAGTAYPAGNIAAALETDDVSSITEPTPRAFRAFANATKADRRALAALQRARRTEPPLDLGALTVPTLIITGEQDTLAGDPAALAAAIPGARYKIVPGNHLSAVLSKEFSVAVTSFLSKPDALHTNIIS